MATISVTADDVTSTLTFDAQSTIPLAQSTANKITNAPDFQSITVSATGSNTVVPDYIYFIAVNTSGATTVSTTSNGVELVAGSGGLTLYEADRAYVYESDIAVAGGNNTIATGRATSYRVATGDGNDVIYGNGYGSIDAGGGTNTITVSDPLYSIGFTSTIYSSGTSDTITLGAGLTDVFESGTSAMVYGGSGADTIADSGRSDTIVGGTGPETIFGGSGGTYFLGSGNTMFVGSTAASGSDVVVAGFGPETIFGGTSDTIFAGNAALTFVGGTGRSTIVGGSGTATIYGNSGSTDTYYGTTGSAVLVAGLGSETLSAAPSTTGVAFVAASGNASLVGGSGNDTVFGGTGSNTVTGGAGADVYAFVNAQTAGTETITDFADNDSVVLIGYGANEVSASLATQQAAPGGGVSITLPDSTVVTFLNLASLNSGRFSGF